LLALLGAHYILHFSRIRVNGDLGFYNMFYRYTLSVNIIVKIDMWENELKPFSVGKFAVHGCSLWQCRELLCRIHRNFDPYLGKHIV